MHAEGLDIARRPVAQSHCHFCGTPFPAGAGWPRTCEGCGSTHWRNPAPVAVAIVPVAGGGLVVVERALDDSPGWALPGGFVDWGEDVATAAARELREETGIVTDAAGYRPFSSAVTPNGGQLLLFSAGPEVSREAVAAAVPQATEIARVGVLERGDPDGLLERFVFGLHADAARAYLS